MSTGFITIERKILDWQWYDDIPAFKLFTHCLLKANFEDATWRGQKCKRGQLITSTANLSIETGLSEKQVRNAIKKLEKTGELGKQTTSRNTLITVVKYDSYQKGGKQRASKGQAKGKVGASKGQQVKKKKEGKEEKQIEKINWSALLKFFNEKTGKKSRVIPDKVKSSINARIKEGFTKQDIFNAIINCANDKYHKDNNLKYLTLEFISRAEKLEKFSTAVTPVKSKRPDDALYQGNIQYIGMG